MPLERPYRTRIAPTPSGLFHLGHARTFWVAQQRAEEKHGTVILRVEDLDRDRCKSEYIEAMYKDLEWFGFQWQEGPDRGGAHAPYVQSQRLSLYLEDWRRLAEAGAIYPSPHSRKDVAEALSAPHESSTGESIFPLQLRPERMDHPAPDEPGAVNWRFRVPDGRVVRFTDALCGTCAYTAGKDFGDFLVWRKDGYPAYELAVITDDHAMEITEVIRGEDLLLSTARQILLYETLGRAAPAWRHCPLVRDARGKRLAKRDGAESLHALRESGATPQALRQQLGLTELGR